MTISAIVALILVLIVGAIIWHDAQPVISECPWCGAVRYGPRAGAGPWLLAHDCHHP